MELTVGTVLEGKVKSITNFGAFVALPDNKTGLVHISEVANAYVSDIHQHLTEGQDVKVMIIAADAGKINLSIKRLEPRPQNNSRPFPRRDQNHSQEGRQGSSRPQEGRQGSFRPQDGRQGFRSQGPRNAQRSNPTPPAAPKTADQLFEEKLKAFMSESDSKISSIRAYSDHRTKNSRRR